MKRYPPPETLPAALLLALAGGILDAYSYLNRGQVFATAETGNLVLFSLHLALRDWGAALRYLLPVLAFAAGVLAAELLRRSVRPATALSWQQSILLVECLVILAVSCLPQGPLDRLANILISFTSAVQMESFRSFRGCACATTMCTGNLRSGTERLFRALSAGDPDSRQDAGTCYGLIACFAAGCVLSGLLSPLLRGRTVLAACAPLAAVFFLIRRPENRPSDSA